MKIAVCLSGQPRVIEHAIPSILSFFSGEHEFDFFCHSWNYNTYKKLQHNPEPNTQPVYWTGDEPVDEVELTTQIQRLNPKKYSIQGVNIIKNYRFPWDSLFYSMMYANYLKKEYEIEMGFRYDFVVKSRYDIIFDPNTKFKLDSNADKNNYLDVFNPYISRMSFEYMRINASDDMFYGSSMAMDFVCDIYRYLLYKAKAETMDDRECLGPGTAMSSFGDEHNIKFHSIVEGLNRTVYRHEMVPADPLTSYTDICNYNGKFYQVIKKDD